MTRALLVPVEGEIKVVEYDSYESLVALLDDGFLESIRLRNIAENLRAFIDEDGKRKELPVNTRATLFAGLDIIVGPMVIVGPVVGEDETDCPQAVIDELLWFDAKVAIINVELP